jgi:hypothetical protein
MASPSPPEVKRADCASIREIFCNARQIFSLSHIAERISCSGITKLQRESGGMTKKFPLNDAEHWRTRAEEARLLAKETKNVLLLRLGDNYWHLAQWVEDWALRRLSRN